ncbi:MULTISPECIES: hypothetical protein [unclassified Pseudoalteromonas]|uniref:hypothetical protein n=1 Tax=unclassified Pseudoalteromonas TaxID=194690 RepID=UPI00390CB58E|nr:hypothetical protein [Ningiella sp. W23]
MVMLFCYFAILLFCYFAILLFCYFAILLLAGSSMLLFGLGVKKLWIAIKALNHFWLVNEKANELTYGKFLFSFFFSSLFSGLESAQRELAISKIKSGFNLVLLSILILLISRNGGFQFVENAIKSLLNAT